ncbi:efflux RND transporter periplasmic adaptor subunit [Pseudomaricurvus alcaniphilus]|uniref:efflux RND transporter periplasmic adaptor subunit n=1 Tax=Pseudomaricurvus alcaniphilus TaxID=1166482 RepID=UPI00140CA201|nr:efflux RND transporter periplasmic adaptor subunit [Pseudomaricurvus alcaniphilus]NHN39029.1 efflux RND transporter periplasmic adaptor subunit [Pseudomaricurvus alcaniphilus]
MNNDNGSPLLYFGFLVLSSLAAMTPVSAQTYAGDENQFDCTIEPRTLALVGSYDEGIIEEVRVKRGDVVKRGQVLAVLDSSMEALTVELARLQAGQDVEIRSGEARLGFQKLERERAETLAKRDILSHKVLDEARVQETIAGLELESASIRRQVANAELALAEARLERRTIRSSIDGIVTEVSKVPGEYIHEQVQLLTLAQIFELNVEVFLPIARYGEIKLQQVAIVEPVAPISGRYRAVVEVVDKVFDAASGTFGVRLRLDNPEGKLPAGIRCTVRFEQPENVMESALHE